MISVIICSRGAAFRKAVTENIAVTIGVPYEVIAIDNSENKYGICEAYNEGAARSIYSILCFAHEDIEFRTQDWGKIVERILLDNSIGVVGVTGGKWLPRAPGTWWTCGNKYISSNILNQGLNQEYSHYFYSNPEEKLLVDVAAVDGLWMCTRKEIWAKYPFDSKVFPGFHFYDVDFCANIFPQCRICVAMEIGITHFSMGNYNNSWFRYADVFYRKHLYQLPLGSLVISTRDRRRQEYALSREFLFQIIARKLPAKIGRLYLANCIKSQPFNKHTLWLTWHYAKFAWRNRAYKPFTDA